MTDNELLELAAKVANIEIYIDENGTPWVDGDKYIWNPLVDDGDALRLAVKISGFGFAMRILDIPILQARINGEDLCAAVRRIIVNAAAEISLTMKDI